MYKFWITFFLFLLSEFTRQQRSIEDADMLCFEVRTVDQYAFLPFQLDLKTTVCLSNIQADNTHAPKRKLKLQNDREPTLTKVNQARFLAGQANNAGNSFLLTYLRQ